MNIFETSWHIGRYASGETSEFHILAHCCPIDEKDNLTPNGVYLEYRLTVYKSGDEIYDYRSVQSLLGSPDNYQKLVYDIVRGVIRPTEVLAKLRETDTQRFSHD